MNLSLVALGVAIGEVRHGVREEGGNNEGPWIAEYLKNCDPPINFAAPWCAAFVQAITDIAAEEAQVPNPLDGVRLEAYVQSYYDWAVSNDALVDDPQPGDLVLYDFRGRRWDHIGFVLTTPDHGGFRAIEGNTGNRSQRDGDGVFVKGRRTNASYPVAFVRWAA